MEKIYRVLVYSALIPSLSALDDIDSQRAPSLNEALLKEQLTVNISQSMKIKKTKKQLEKALNQLQISQQEQSHLAENMAKYATKHKKLRNKLSLLAQEHDKKRDAYKACKHNLRTAQGTIQTLESTIGDLRTELSAQCAQNATLKKDLLLTEATTNGIAEEAGILKNDLEQVKRELQASLAEKNNLQEQLVQTLQENEERSLLLTKLQNSLHIQERSVPGTTDSYQLSHNNQESNPAMKAVIDRLYHEITHLNDQCRTANNHIQTLQMSNQKLCAQVTTAHNNYTAIQVEYAQKCIDYTQLHNEVVALTNEKHHKELALLAQGKELSCWQHEANLLQLENESLRREKDELVTNTDFMKHELETMNYSCIALQSELSSLQKSIHKSHRPTMNADTARSLYADNHTAARRHKVLRKTIYT